MQLVEPRPSRPMPIRLTPLIDVVFILLVFFMLTSRLLPVAELKLDGTSPDHRAAAGDPLPELTLVEAGRVLWQGQTLGVTDLIAELTRAGVTELQLITRPETRLGDFTRTLARLDEAGIRSHWVRTPRPAP